MDDGQAWQYRDTGKIDVIGHSMGATLAAQQIDELVIASQVNSFVGIAGALLDSLYGSRFAQKVYSIKSYSDQVVCATGSCLVYGIHSSSIWGENASYNYVLGHFGLQTDTAAQQYQLIK